MNKEEKKNKVLFSYEHETDAGIITYEVEATIKAYTETYGSDLDGNRGETRTFVDSVEIDRITESGTDVNPDEDIIDSICEKAESLWNEGAL